MYSSDPTVGTNTLVLHPDALIDTSPADRRPALVAIMKSMLVSYSHLLNALLAPPPNGPSEGPSDHTRHLEWIRILAQNIMAAANDMRPVQVRHHALHKISRISRCVQGEGEPGAHDETATRITSRGDDSYSLVSVLSPPGNLSSNLGRVQEM